MKKILVMIALCSSLSYSAERDTYNYELKDSKKVVYRGQTKDPHRRELEHKRDGKEFTHMVIVGNVKTRQGALKSEKKEIQKYRNNHNGQNPKYNQTDHG